MSTSTRDEEQVQENQEAAVLLGMASGVYQQSAVRPELRQHFSVVWFHHKESGHPAKTAVVPDNCADLVWCRGRLLVAGPDREVTFEPVPPGVTVVGLRFRPGAVGNWLRTPASEIVGLREGLDCFWPKKIEEIMEAIGDATDPHVIAQRLQIGVAKMAPEINLPDRSTRLILSAIRHLRNANRPITRILTAALGVSERTLRRVCEKEFGYGAKTLDRIVRMQDFLDLAISQPFSNLTFLAAAVGYADQAHLTREARRLTGLTPKVILAQIAESRHAPNGIFD